MRRSYETPLQLKRRVLLDQNAGKSALVINGGLGNSFARQFEIRSAPRCSDVTPVNLIPSLCIWAMAARSECRMVITSRSNQKAAPSCSGRAKATSNLLT